MSVLFGEVIAVCRKFKILSYGGSFRKFKKKTLFLLCQSWYTIYAPILRLSF